MKNCNLGLLDSHKKIDKLDKTFVKKITKQIYKNMYIKTFFFKFFSRKFLNI